MEKENKQKQNEIFETYEILDYQYHLSIMFPKDATKIMDHDSKDLDKAGHPINFIYNDDNYSTFYGFKITSHPSRSDDLKEFFFVTINHPSEVTYTDSKKIKENSYFHCAHIEKYEGFVYEGFEQKGNIKIDIYQEKMSEVLAKHILLQEEKLATKDPYTDILLDNMCLTRDEIINSPRYQAYRAKLYGKNLQPRELENRTILITMEQEKVKNLEESKKR